MMTDDKTIEQVPTPDLYEELFPGKFLLAGALGGKPLRVTIERVVSEIMPLYNDLRKKPEHQRHQTVHQVVLSGRAQRLRLNKTNAQCLKEMFGSSLPGWSGKRVDIHPTVDDGKDCIRVWGSPDIPGPIDVTIDHPIRKKYTISIRFTGVNLDSAASEIAQAGSVAELRAIHARVSQSWSAEQQATLTKLLSARKSRIEATEPERIQ